MAPTPKYTRDEILNIAFKMVRENGYASLTARDLGAKLGTSARPIFTAFKGMEELKKEIIFKANTLFEKYKKDEIESQKYPEYKACGMAYIRFAKEEKNLFKLLFMRDRSEETGIEDVSISNEVALIEKNLSLSTDSAIDFHIKMWILMHGFATVLATSYLDLDLDVISRMTSEVYNSLKEGNKP